MPKDTPKDDTIPGEELEQGVVDALSVAIATPAAPAAAAEPTEFPLPLGEFCARLSATDNRIEMIGAFHATEKAAGHTKDLDSAYRSRFAAFCNAPA